MREHRQRRYIARNQLSRRDLLTIVIFATGHPDTPFARLLVNYVRGVGPAAIAAGRTGRAR